MKIVSHTGFHKDVFKPSLSKSTAVFLVFVFAWTNLGIYQAVYAAENSKELKGSSSLPLLRGTEGGFDFFSPLKRGDKRGVLTVTPLAPLTLRGGSGKKNLRGVTQENTPIQLASIGSFNGILSSAIVQTTKTVGVTLIGIGEGLPYKKVEWHFRIGNLQRIYI